MATMQTTSEADWTLALERESVVSEYEAEAIEQAVLNRRYRTQRRWLPHREEFIVAANNLITRARRQAPSV